MADQTEEMAAQKHTRQKPGGRINPACHWLGRHVACAQERLLIRAMKMFED